MGQDADLDAATMDTATATAPGQSVLRHKLRRIANETAELPGLSLVAEPIYRRWFGSSRSSATAFYSSANLYYGAFHSYAQAQAQAQALAPQWLPTTYDNRATGRMYRDRFESIRVSDYPLTYWLMRLLAGGQRRLFDLGGHTGVSYYGFERYLDYPRDMRWLIHDTPAAVAAGRTIAETRDVRRQLEFTERREDADGHEVLVSSGTLQYLDYTLPDLLVALKRPPPHVLVNLTPMHPSKGYFTLQHIGVAILPYRVSAVPEFIAAMEAAGYCLVDRWESFERHLRIPFEPSCTIDRYYGFYFRHASDPAAPLPDEERLS